ncbi:MAG TPA: signal recognition particle-docking protein FtsY, partial [Actinomycetota bacterium]
QRWRNLHDDAVRSDPAAHAYVQALERDFDLAAEAAIPSADDLAADFEAFLRAHNEPPSAPDPAPDPDPDPDP